MRVLPGEHVLYESESTKNGTLTVSTHRVTHEQHGVGQGTIKSIMLEEVASCAMMRQTYPALLVLAVISVVVGVIANLQDRRDLAPVGIGLLIGVVLVLCYFGKREQGVTIASAGATIFFNTVGWTLAEVRELMDEVDGAKNARYLAHSSTPISLEDD
jgi:hypothetical protein